jgi:hypothetical protein
MGWGVPWSRCSGVPLSSGTVLLFADQRENAAVRIADGGRELGPGRAGSTPLQGYLAHKKPTPP